MKDFLALINGCPWLSLIRNHNVGQSHKAVFVFVLFFQCRLQQLHSVGEREWELIDDNSILKRNDSLACRLILDPPVQLCQAEHHLPYPKSVCMDSAHHWPYIQATRVNFPPCQWEFDGHLWWLMLLSGQISMTWMWCWWVFLIVSSGFRNSACDNVEIFTYSSELLSCNELNDESSSVHKAFIALHIKAGWLEICNRACCPTVSRHQKR